MDQKYTYAASAPAIPQVGTEVLKVAEFASVLGVGQVRDGRFSRQEAGILRNRE